MKFKLGYILWWFPRFSETFILNEMHFLREQFSEIDFSLYVIKESDENVTHAYVEKFLRQAVFTPPVWNPQFFLQGFFYAVRHPIVVLRVFTELMREIPFEISFRLSVYYFLQSMFCLAEALYLSGPIAKKKIQHLHTHFAESSGLITCITSKLTGIPYSLTLHGQDIFANPNHKLIAFLIRHSKFSTTVSQFNKNYILAFDPSLEPKLDVIHCGIDPMLFNRNGKVRSQVFRILTIARLVKTKGIDDLIKACHLLPKEMNYRCIVVGDGPEREKLQRLVHRYQLESHIEFTGYLSQNEVYEQLNRASVFVLPTYTEGLPVSLMETMAMSVPVISTRIQGIPELVRDGAGILIEPGDINQLAEAIRRVYSLREEDRRLMGRKARAIVEQGFDIRRQVSLLYHKYLQPVLA